MICPSCGSEGNYREIEDIDHECNYVYWTAWQCNSCDVYLNQYDEKFEWGED